MARPRVVRTTRSLIFITTEVTAGKRTLVMANGVFKILKKDFLVTHIERIARHCERKRSNPYVTRKDSGCVRSFRSSQ